MGDQAHDFAERKIAEFQAEVRETYQQVQADAQEALSRFLKRFEKEDDRQREKVKAGELSEADYKAWRKGKILRSRQLSSTLDQVSQAMTEANQVAMAALRGKLPEVYAENANYAAFSICKETGVAVAFDLVDPDTVGHMLTAGAALLPAVDVAKDVAWNRKLVSSQLTQGVLLGESIPKIARRVQSVTGSNIATATRTARTAVTGAECAGRMASYERAKGMGIKLKKEWVSTLDNRTRHSHRQLDGERIENKESAKFSNGCRYPGDPTARYAEICNCRCTVIAAVEGFETDDAKRLSRLPEGVTYEEWKWGKERGISTKKAASPNAAVDLEYINSSKYRAKFDELGVSAKTASSLHKEAVAMLNHRNGTLREDMALVSAKTGEVVARSSGAKADLETSVTKKVASAVKASSPHELIGMHNHPNSLPPTGSDIATADQRRYAFGLVICHNGDVFRYNVADGSSVSGMAFDMKVRRLTDQGMSEPEAIKKTLDQYEADGRIAWRKI